MITTNRLMVLMTLSGRTLKIVAVSLVVCLVLLSGIFAGQAVAHALHHAQHHAATHATPLCAWMCAAGEVLEGYQFIPQATASIIGLAEFSGHSSPATVVFVHLPPRGPPVQLA